MIKIFKYSVGPQVWREVYVEGETLNHDEFHSYGLLNAIYRLKICDKAYLTTLEKDVGSSKYYTAMKDSREIIKDLNEFADIVGSFEKEEVKRGWITSILLLEIAKLIE